MDKEYREFWILDKFFGSELSSNPEDHKAPAFRVPMDNRDGVTHVIEIQALKDCEAKLQEASEIIEMLKGALEFYSNEDTYLLHATDGQEWDFMEDARIWRDSGKKSKQALAHPKLKAWEGELK